MGAPARRRESARHLPARASQWQAGRKDSAGAGGPFGKPVEQEYIAGLAPREKMDLSLLGRILHINPRAL
jgi:hypothetical protein